MKKPERTAIRALKIVGYVIHWSYVVVGLVAMAAYIVGDMNSVRFYVSCAAFLGVYIFASLLVHLASTAELQASTRDSYEEMVRNLTK